MKVSGQLLIKSMPICLYGAFEFLSFKNSIYKKDREYSQTERVKKHFQRINFVKNI